MEDWPQEPYSPFNDHQTRGTGVLVRAKHHKGDTANIGVVIWHPRHYSIMVREVTAGRVKALFGDFCKGEVERIELPSLGTLNFHLHESPGDSGTTSRRGDAQSKTFGVALLRMEIEVDEREL